MFQRKKNNKNFISKNIRPQSNKQSNLYFLIYCSNDKINKCRNFCSASTWRHSKKKILAIKSNWYKYKKKNTTLKVEENMADEYEISKIFHWFFGFWKWVRQVLGLEITIFHTFSFISSGFYEKTRLIRIHLF